MHNSGAWVGQQRCAWTDECLPPGLRTGIGYTDNGILWKSHVGITAGTLYLGNSAAVPKGVIKQIQQLWEVASSLEGKENLVFH